MNKLITLAVLSALTLHAQTPAPAKAEPSTTEIAATPVLTSEWKLKLRDAQVPAMKDAQAFTALVQRIQQMPEYLKFKAAADASAERLSAIAQEAVKAAGCPDCKIDDNTLALTRPQPKTEEKKEK